MTTARLSTLAAAAILFSTVLAGPAMAIDGRNAVGRCIDDPKCFYTLDPDGGITIIVADGTIHCPSATAECTLIRVAPKPQMGVGRPSAGAAILK